MPRRRFMKKQVRKPKVYRKRFAKRGVKILSPLQPFPSRQIVHMKYSEAVVTNSTLQYNYAFNLNSIFDPNRTGTGHQPMGRDQLAVLYNRYRVIGCKYIVQAYAGGSAIRYGVCPANEVKVFTTIAELAESPRAQWRLSVPGGTPTKISGYVSIPSLIGRSRAEYLADDRYQATFDSNPQELAILNISGLDIGEVGVNLNWTIELVYIVEVFDPHPLSQS